jgi:gluconolactonase
MVLTVRDLHPVALGIDRPEDVLMLAGGLIVASDAGSAVAQLDEGGSFRRIGRAGGIPNGLGALPDGKVAIANFELGCLQELDLEHGTVRVIADRTVDGQVLRFANYPLVDYDGGIWLSCCTARSETASALAVPKPDGMIVYVDKRGAATVAAHLIFPNCMALDSSGAFLYACRTATTDIVRFRILGPGKLGEEERFGPPLGGRGPDETSEEPHNLLADSATLRRWGLADGCAFDAPGNLWITLAMSDEIIALSPAGEQVAVELAFREGKLAAPTSICWGGSDMRDVYIGSLTAPYVLRGRSSVPGVARFSNRS